MACSIAQFAKQRSWEEALGLLIQLKLGTCGTTWDFTWI
jgi:hypothetical protein